MTWFKVEMFQIHYHLHFPDPKQKTVSSLDQREKEEPQ